MATSAALRMWFNADGYGSTVVVTKDGGRGYSSLGRPCALRLLPWSVVVVDVSCFPPPQRNECDFSRSR